MDVRRRGAGRNRNDTTSPSRPRPVVPRAGARRLRREHAKRQPDGGRGRGKEGPRGSAFYIFYGTVAARCLNEYTRARRRIPCEYRRYARPTIYGKRRNFFTPPLLGRATGAPRNSAVSVRAPAARKTHGAGGGGYPITADFSDRDELTTATA